MLRGSTAGLKYSAGQALRKSCAERSVRFCELHADDATKHFVDTAPVATPSQSLAHRFLAMVMSYYDANATLGIYPLHLFSRDQWTQLLHETTDRSKFPQGFQRALDIGAGDGSMAQTLLMPIAHEVHATETSKKMAALARERGVDCHDVDLTAANSNDSTLKGPFHLITVFNVLDRTNRPRTLLEKVSGLLASDGICVIASPLPMRQVCFEGARRKKPEESLPLPDTKSPALAAYAGEDVWDAYAYSFMFEFLKEQVPDLKIEGFTRLPYLSSGDFSEPLVKYDDIAVVLSKRN